VGQSVAIGDKQFEVVKEFVNLGSLMTPTNGIWKYNEESRLQVLLRTARTSAVEPPFTPNKIHHSQDLDPPSPALRRETWVLTKREENQLLVFERKVLRTICSPKIENSVYKRR
jgi:hypothetical protein